MSPNVVVNAELIAEFAGRVIDALDGVDRGGPDREPVISLIGGGGSTQSVYREHESLRELPACRWPRLLSTRRQPLLVVILISVIVTAAAWMVGIRNGPTDSTVVSVPPQISPSETTLRMRTDFLGLLRFMLRG
jgi:hypothetical protein